MSTTRPAIREKVYEALDGERAYQENRPNALKPENQAMGTQLLVTEVYLRKAVDAFIASRDKASALDAIRKVTAMGVRIMELHGIEFRQ